MENIKSGAAVGEPGLKQRVIDCNMFGPSVISQITKEISRDINKFNELREAVSDLSAKRDMLSPSAVVKLGVCQYLIGNLEAARETLENGGDKSALDLYYRAQIALQFGEFDNAVQSFTDAEKAGYDKGVCALGRAEAYRNAGNVAESLRELDSICGETEQTADYLYQRGATTAAMLKDDDQMLTDQMLRWYERAHERDKNHPGALFGMAIENERRGNDEEALSYYQRLACLIPTHAGALINLGLLYEDRENYEEAVKCYRRVLDAYPRNIKAQMYLKDAEASLNRGGRGNRIPIQKLHSSVRSILEKSVTDYELSARSRKGLQAMGIDTLGDLCKKTEKELLSFKNFGDSSLDEVRKILEQAGLKFGSRDPEPMLDAAESDDYDADPAANAFLSHEVEDLNLTVRARRCLQRKDIRTIAELVKKTATDLLNSKNFGVTSLTEIRKKLAEHGLKLKDD